MPSHEERAREICSPEYFGGVRANDAQHVADVAEALRTVELEALERAAKVAEHEESLREGDQVFPCIAIAACIRSLSRNETGGGN